jgi:molybdate transport system ATP-binding protein
MSALQATIRLSRGSGFRLDLEADLPLEGLTAVVGPSGSGKTSLLYCLAGLLPGDAGTVLRFDDRQWQGEGVFVPAHKRRVGFVFQDARLFPHLDVAGNLRFAEQRRVNDSGPGRSEVVEWLQLEKLLATPATQLSAGQRQRVAIARALLSAPQLLLFDEPLANLDRSSRQQIVRYLERLSRETAIPMVYVSHDMEEVSQLADQLLLLRDGQVAASGPLIELSSRLELGLAHEEQAAAIVNAELRGRDADYGLCEMNIEGQTLYVSDQHAAPGTAFRLRIPARDVSLCLEPPQQSSILNVLQVQIDEVETGGAERLLLRLRLGSQFLLARLTRKSVDRLGLKPGMTAYAQVKSVALLTERREEST